MTILSEPPVTSTESTPADRKAARKRSFGSAAVSWVTSTDHKVIGYMYLITATMWFFIAGLMALAIRVSTSPTLRLSLKTVTHDFAAE